MDLEFKKREKVVGFFIIIICLLLIFSFVLIGRGKGLFKKYVQYYTVFNDAYNLQDGAPVKLYNADIGKVRDIELVEDKVRVELLIVDEFKKKVRKSSYVTVKSPTFIGSEYLALVTGSKDSPLIPEEGQIPSIEKKSLTDLMSEFQVEKTAKKFVESVQDLSDIIAKLKSDKGPFFSVLYDIQKIVSDIEKGKGNIGQILRTKTIVNEISVILTRVEKILEDVSLASSKTPYTVDLVNKNLERVDSIGKNFDESSRSLNSLLNDLKKRMNDIALIIKNIEKGSGDIPEITKSALDSIQEIRFGVKKADDAIQALQKNFLIRNNLPERKEPGQYESDTRP
ncbi:MAG: hypothetical protein CSA18_00340 [Deltaproteobacteria bacterium]|nr:MAG: hypothetical protein CSA18_00340 [Deltaproteobacteria bacterium]